MKKKLLMLALMVVLVASALALSISAANIVKLDYDPGLDCEDSLVSILDGEYAPYTPVTWASVTGGLDENARCVLTDGNGGYYVFPSWYIYKDEAYETNNANNHNGYRHCINYTRLNAAIAKYNTDNQTEHFASYSVSSSNHANLVRLTMIEGVANLAQNTQKFQNSALLVELRFPSTMSTTDAQNALDKTPLTKVDLSMTTITTLPNAFCANMASLTEVKLPDTITKINGSVFAECGELTTINIPSSLKEIGSKAFYNCKKMQYISGTDGLLIFPEGFTSISANSAFYNCDLIKYVEFPSTFTYLGQAAFNDCSNLLLVSFDKVDAKIKSAIANGEKYTPVTFNNCGSFKNCPELMAMSIPEGTTVVINRFLANCPKLTAVYMPNSVKEIGTNGNGQNGAFSDNKNMYFVSQPFTVNQCIVDGKIDTSKLVLPEKPSVYYMPTSLVEFIGHTFDKNAQANVFRGCTNINDVLVFPESFKVYNIAKGFDCMGTSGNVKTIVFLADMEGFIYGQCDQYINFVFANPNDKGLDSYETLYVCKTSYNTDAYLFFCATGTRYSLNVSSRASTESTVPYNTVMNNAYNEAYNSKLEEYYQAAYDAAIAEGMSEEEAIAAGEAAKTNNTNKNNAKKAGEAAKLLPEVIAAAKEARDTITIPANEAISATGEQGDCHVYVIAKNTAPTCTEDGVIGFVCFCGEKDLENSIVDPAPGHTKGNVVAVEYANGYLAYGAIYHKCTVCDVEKYTYTDNAEYIAAPIFVNNGYSYSGTAILQGFAVNLEALGAYEATGKTVQYGLAVASVAKLGATNTLFDGTTLKTGAYSVSFDDKKQYSIFEMQVTGLVDDYKDAELFVCAYVIDGDTVTYISNGANTTTVEAVTYNQVVANAEANQTTDIIVKKEENV